MNLMQMWDKTHTPKSFTWAWARQIYLGLLLTESTLISWAQWWNWVVHRSHGNTDTNRSLFPPRTQFESAQAALQTSLLNLIFQEWLLNFGCAFMMGLLNFRCVFCLDIGRCGWHPGVASFCKSQEIPSAFRSLLWMQTTFEMQNIWKPLLNIRLDLATSLWHYWINKHFAHQCHKSVWRNNWLLFWGTA